MHIYRLFPVTTLTFEEDSFWVTQNHLYSHLLLLCSFVPSPHLLLPE